jgi:DNA-binding transcriptional LysR family regulator
MDLRTMRCFIAVAEQLHFRRAAGQLNMTQPALSLRIRALEKEVGTRLLERDRRSVRLTEAGRAFLDHARVAVRSGTDAIARARGAARGETGGLRFGFTALSAYADMPELVQRFRLACPSVHIELVQGETAGLAASLLSDEIDVALLHPPLAVTGLRVKELPPDEMVLALPSAHPLAKLKTVPLSKLAGEPFLLGPRRIGPHLYDQIILACRAAGFSPNVVQEVASMTTLIGLVAAGSGCGFVPSSLQVIRRPGVTFRRLANASNAPRLSTALAWRDGSLSAAAQQLVRLSAGLGAPRVRGLPRESA